jgi:glycosyltransferase involved in cell wall biosynthesis
MSRRLRVLAVASHPVQYMAPNFRRLAAVESLDLRVSYFSLRGAEAAHDPDFATKVQWDVPLLDGYVWSRLSPRSLLRWSTAKDPGIWHFIRSGGFDAVLCFTGYVCLDFWIALLASRLSGAAFLFGTDSSTLGARDGRRWKVIVKKLLWPHLFGLANQVIVPSTNTKELMISLGISQERITLTPYTVDNDWWIQRSQKVDRAEVRRSWSATEDDLVVLFCAKLQSWKGPQELLLAFAEAKLANALLIIAGDGPLRSQLSAEAQALKIAERVRFLGFVNQSQLPAIYASSDVMVLPSNYEPFGVVVNEAMCCGCPVIASDRVGAARDLIAPINQDFIYPSGDVGALSARLRTCSLEPMKMKRWRKAVTERMRTWSPAQNIAATVEAIDAAVGRANTGRPRDEATEPASEPSRLRE